MLSKRNTFQTTISSLAKLYVVWLAAFSIYIFGSVFFFKDSLNIIKMVPYCFPILVVTKLYECLTFIKIVYSQVLLVGVTPS